MRLAPLTIVFSALLLAAISGVALATQPASNSAGFAISFDYVVPADTSAHLSVAAWNEAIEYQRLSAETKSWPKRYKEWRLGEGTVGGAEFTDWKVHTLPAHGRLYDNERELVEAGTFSGPDALVYVPNKGYQGADQFSYAALARSSNAYTDSAIVRLRVASSANYPLPVAFEAPWGIALSPPADPDTWPQGEQPGFFYIDSDHPQCNDDSRYGYPDRPRCSFVSHNTKVPAGGKVVLAPSTTPYRLVDDGSHRLHLLGTADNPTWLVGVDNAPVKPTITTATGRDAFTEFQINGSYMVISGVRTENLKISHRHNKEDRQVDDHILLRHSEVAGYNGRTGNAINLAGVSGMNKNASNVGIFNVSVHDNGPRDPGLAERDVHGMGFGACTDCTILDVVSYGNGGDSYQNLQHNRNVDTRIGRLKGHSEGENCVDIKAQNGLWVMDSDCWDLRTVRWSNGSTGNGQGFFQNDDDCSRKRTCEQLGDVIFLNNRAWDTNGPGYGSSIFNGSHYLIGNRAFAMPEGSCISISNGDGSTEGISATHVYFNSLTNCGVGIRAKPNANVTRIAGNVIDNSKIAMWMQNPKNLTDMNRNYYTTTKGDTEFQCCSNSQARYLKGLRRWQRVTGHGRQSAQDIEARFADALTGDLAINADSGLVAQFTASDWQQHMPGIQEVLKILGVSSIPDWNGTPRFSGKTEDAGADQH
ncbi:MAG: hypothetical protein AB8B93_13730 [Pseudomonadales bacterium]